MSVMDTDIQWFIARDGKQHGPLSDAEIRKLVELGHMRPTDLIWRQGFPDWRAAAAVFPMTAQAAAAPKPAPAPERTAPAPSAQQPAGPSPQPSFASQQRIEPTTGRPKTGPRPMVGAGPAPVRPPIESRSPSGVSSPERRGTGRVFLVAGLLLALIGGASWFGYQNREALMSLAGPDREAAVPKTEPADAQPASTPAKADAAPKSSFDAAAAAAGSEQGLPLVEKLEKRPLWAALKQEFPDWYGERFKEAAKLSADGKSELEVTQHLIDGFVALRRQNADKALAASTVRHKELAAAFRDNLKKLSEENAETCYNFISKGESSPAAVALMVDGEKGKLLETQVLAVVAAIAEGRKTPATHVAPVKADYDALAAELGRLGWTQADMQLFADPKALAKAPHERVCKMVQDWFSAHLSIQDAGTQERLLFETLKPVIAG